mgnify:CR=1 FL=1
MANPWFKLFPKDWLGATAELTLEEQGAYMRVLARIHEQGHSLIDDDQKVAKTVGVSTRPWRRIKSGLIKAGKLVQHDGLLINVRASRDLEEFDEKLLQTLAKLSRNLPETSPKHPAQAVEKIEAGSPKPEARGQKPDPRKRLSATFQKQLLKALGKPRNATGVKFDPVEQWLAQGVPRALILSVISARVEARLRANKPPPQTFQYFNQAIAEAYAETRTETLGPDHAKAKTSTPRTSRTSDAELFAQVAARCAESDPDGQPDSG